MSGLAEILAENQRLRDSMATLEVSIRHKDSELRDKDSELRDKDTEVAKLSAMVEAVQASADAMAKQLAFLERQNRAPATQRFVPEEQDMLPFPGDIEPPPRAPTREPEEQDDSEGVKKEKRRTQREKPRRRNRESFAQMGSRKIVCKADPDATCAGCGGALKVIGKAESFRIEWVPGHFVVDDVIRDKCACPKCPDQGVLTVPGPYALDRSLCANGLLARVIVDKFCDHIPLNRQAKRMGREGFKVGSNTLANWVKSVGGLLRVVAKAVRADLLARTFLQGDDTGMPVQDGGDGKLRKGRMWAFTDQQQVFYAFTESKAGEFPALLLDGYAGELLLVDGGSEFNQVVREQGLQRGGCWSHLRTYFFNARHDNPVEATLALGTIRDIFMLERELQGLTPDEILAARRDVSTPLIDGFFTWVQAISTTVRPKSKLGEAVTYATNQQAAMRLHLTNPEMPMHNNLSELMLRQTVVGRKNWLFARSEGGAKVAADCYTLVGSCMLQGIDPHAYLVDMLDRLPDHPSNRVHELTPAAWAREKR